MFGTIIATVATIASLFGPGVDDQPMPEPARLVTAPITFLTVDFGAVPDDVWGALVVDDQGMSDPQDGAERLYFPIGSRIDIPGGWVRATDEGWWSCEDWTTTGAECSDSDAGEPAGWVA